MSKTKKFQKFVKEVINDNIKGSYQMEADEARLGLIEEVGELMQLYKRQMRDHEHYDEVYFIGEIGDILHYLVRIMIAHDLTLDEVMDYNIEKIKERNNL